MTLSVPTYSDPERLVPFLPSERADTARAAAAQRAQAQGGEQGKEIGFFGGEEASFWDVLDVINPLQHIPVVNTLYREMTGDQIGMGARVAGGALFGGPIGIAAALVNAAIEQETGKDIGGHTLAMFRDDPAAADTMLANTESPAADVDVDVEIGALGINEAAKPVMANAPQQPLAQPAAVVQGSSALDQALQAFVAAQGTMTGTGPMPAANTHAAEMALAQATGRPLPGMPTNLGLAGNTAQNSQAQNSRAQNDQAQNLAQNNPAQNLAHKGGKVYPVPERRRFDEKPVAPVQVPVSNTGNNSATPVTGRDPVAGANPYNARPQAPAPAPAPTVDPGVQGALAVQKAAAAQGIADLDHPMLNPAQTAQQGEDWFTAAWGQALAKYQRNQALNTGQN